MSNVVRALPCLRHVSDTPMFVEELGHDVDPLLGSPPHAHRRFFASLAPRGSWPPLLPIVLTLRGPRHCALGRSAGWHGAMYERWTSRPARCRRHGRAGPCRAPLCMRPSAGCTISASSRSACDPAPCVPARMVRRSLSPLAVGGLRLRPPRPTGRRTARIGAGAGRATDRNRRGCDLQRPARALARTTRRCPKSCGTTPSTAFRGR